MKKRKPDMPVRSDERKCAGSVAGARFGKQASTPLKDMQRLVHELEVRQIELEVQNEELRRNRLELQAAHDRYAELYRFSPAGLLTLDRHGVIQEANIQTEVLLRVQRGDLIRQPFVRFIAPDEQSLFVRRFHDAFRTGAKQSCDLSLFHPESAASVIHLVIQAFPDETGARTYCRFALFDVTEHKRTEALAWMSKEKLRQAVEASGTGLWDWNTETNEMSFSPEWKHQLGYDGGDLPEVFETLESRLHPEDRDRVLVYIRDYLANPQGPYRQEIRLRHKDGNYRWIEARASFVTGTTGRRVRLLGTHVDITEQKQTEEQLQDTVSRVRILSQRLNAAQEEERIRIARELHDELGVRLTCLKLDLSRFQSMKSPLQCADAQIEDKICKMIAEVDATIESIQRLVSELRPGILDDLGLVAAVEWQCEDFERRSGIRCLCESSQDITLDPSCATAAFRICQEALTNVMRHAKATFVRVMVSQTQGDLLLEIQDDGKGISTEELSNPGALGLLGMRERASGLGGILRSPAGSGGGRP